MGAELFRKYVSSSMIICYRSVLRHPFLVCTLFLLIWMQRLFPLFFSFLVSSSPVIVSTAVLLGTLLSFGQPNIPEIEKEPKSEQYEIQKLESKVTSQTEIVGRDGNFASEETNGSKFEVGDKSFEVINPVNDDNSCVEVDKPRYMVDDGEFVTEEICETIGEEHLLEESKNETDEVKVVLGSHYSPLQQSEDEDIVLESDDKLWEGSADPLNSDPALLWKRVEGDGYDDDEDDHDDDDDDESDSGSDLAESSSPDASMADIIPMLDELHPLLSEEHEIRREPDHEDGIKNHEDSEHSLGSSDSSSESNNEDGVQNHEDLEAGDEEDGEDEEDEEEDKESKHTDKEDEPRSAITWTEDDQKNLMNLGTSEMERNRRLENLIARRRARKTMRMQAEKNLIDLESADLPWNISPISTARRNPFDYDLDEHIPGSAPSVLLKRRNPFDLPYDSSEEKPDLVGDTFQQEFAGFQPKETVFRRHESFNVGPSNFGALRSERQETKLRPYFVPERPFQRQFSGISDSKASSVPETESVSSASDIENNDHIEDEQSLEPELVSEKDQELSESHERPYFVPEHVDSVGTSFLSYERQISEVSESKLSSIPDTESVSSADDLENKDHIDLSQEPGLISFEDDGIVESVQVPEGDERLDEAEIQQVVNVESSMEIMAEVIHRSASSLSSSDEVSEQIYNEKEGDDNDEVATSVSETSDYFVDDGNSIERSEIDVTSLLVELSHPKEPVYDSSPRAVTRNLSSSSISNDLQAILERNGSFGKDSQESVPKMEDHLHKDESFQHVDDQHQSSNSADVVLDKDACHSHELEQVQVPSSSSNGRSHESTHQEEVISQPEEDPEQLQVQEVKQGEVTSSQFAEVVHGETTENPDPAHHQFVSKEEEAVSQSQKEVPLLDTSANEPSEDIPELLQVQNTSNNLDNLQIQEPGNDVVEAVGIEDIHSNNVPDNIDDVDEEINGIDEDLLVELDAVGDFSVNDLISTSNEMEDNPHALDHVLETKHSGDEDSHSKDLGSILDEMDHHPHALEHDLETKHSADEDSYSKDLELEQHPHFLDRDLETKLSGDEEDSYSKDLGATLGEMKQDPHGSKRDLETKLSGDEDSFSKDLGSILDEMEHHPYALDHVLETKHSADEDSYSKDLGLEHPHFLDHDLETKLSEDEEDSYSKDQGATLDEMKQDPHGSKHDLETKLSGDEEDSYSEAIESTLNETTHGLETFYSVDEYAFSKIVESTLNEMKHEPETLDHVLETNLSGDQDLYPTDLSELKLKMGEQVMEVHNEKESSDTEVAGASEAEAESFQTKLTGNTNEVALPQETESKSTSSIMVNHGTENEHSSSTSNTHKE